MPETSSVIDPLRHPAFARALDAGHAAAAAGHWSAAAARFSDALDAIDAGARDASGDAADPHVAVALSNLGQALARVGRWADAEAALRRAAHARDALVQAGHAAPSVAARGWSDVAALLAAAGPEAEARDALARARALLTGADDRGVLASLDETAALIGVAMPLRSTPVEATPSDSTRMAADDDAFEPLAIALPEPAPAAPPRPTPAEAFALDVPVLEAAAPDDDALALADDATLRADDTEAAEDTSVDAAWRPTPVFDAEPLDADGPDLDALLALAAGPPDPEPPTVELDAGDSMADALDAAMEWTPTPAGALPAVVAAPGEPAPEPEPALVATPPRASYAITVDLDADDDADATPELLTPGVDLDDLHGPHATAPARAAGGVGRGQRLAAIDAIVDLTEERKQPARGGGLRALLRRLTGR